MGDDAFYIDDCWDFLSAKDEGTKAIRSVNKIIKSEVEKQIPKELGQGIVYRMISHEVDKYLGDKNTGREEEPTVVVLVKRHSCLRWHVVEAQIKDAVNGARAGTRF